MLKSAINSRISKYVSTYAFAQLSLEPIFHSRHTCSSKVILNSTIDSHIDNLHKALFQQILVADKNNYKESLINIQHVSTINAVQCLYIL